MSPTTIPAAPARRKKTQKPATAAGKGQRKAFFLKPATVAGAVLGLAAIIIYTITLAPDVLAHDSGEWQAAGATLGITHGPGTPAYTIVSWLFSLIPIGSAAARVSYVSVITSAAGVVAVYALMMIIFGRMLPALVSAVTLGVARLWWSQASVAVPYNTIVLIMAVLLILLLLWRKSGDNRLVWGGALLAGFGYSWHTTMLFFLPVMVVGIFVLGPWRQLLKPLPFALTIGMFIVGFSFYAYVPIRSAMNPAVVAFTKVDSLSSFKDYLSGAETRPNPGHEVIRVPGLGDIKARLTEVVRSSYYPSYAFLVFGPAIVLLYPAVWPRIKPFVRILLFLLAGMVLQMTMVILISGMYDQYYLPLLFYFSIWVGFAVYLIMTVGESYLEGEKLSRLLVAATGVFFFAMLALGVPRVWFFVNHANDVSMRRYVDDVFATARPDAVILADWDSYTGLLYAQKVDGERPDLTLKVSLQPAVWREEVSQLESEYPRNQILLSRTLPMDQANNIVALSQPIFVSIKGRTYQDYSHGEPLPVALQLFEVKDTTS